MTDNVQDEVETEFRDVSDPYTHIAVDDLDGVQKKTFDVEFTGTLDQLQTDAPDGLRWELPEEMKDFLRHTTKTRNRSVIEREHLEGDLGKALFLGATVDTHRSTCPIKTGMKITGLVGQTLSKNGVFSHVIPANVPYTVLNKNIFYPNNIFTKHMYKNGKKWDAPTLKKQIVLKEEEGIAQLDVNGIGYSVLMDNLDKLSDQEYNEIMTTNEHIMTGVGKARFAEVPYATGKELFDTLSKPLHLNDAAYTDMNDFHIKLVREDGRAWNDHIGLVIASYAHGEESVGAENNLHLHTPFRVEASITFEYVLNH